MTPHPYDGSDYDGWCAVCAYPRTAEVHRTERVRCLEVLTYTWVCPRCKTAQAQTEQALTGDCRTCLDVVGRFEAWERSKAIQAALRKIG